MRVFGLSAVGWLALWLAVPCLAEAGQPGRPEEGVLKVGDLAPDFDLKRLEGEGTVKLSGFRDKKPVALIFGSYT